MRWWQSPSPGSLGIAYLGEEFNDSCFSSAFVGYLPDSYKKQAALPLVVYLHGSGEKGHDPEKLFQFAQILVCPNEVETPAVVLLPQCRPQCSWQVEDICRFVASSSQRYHIDQQRVYLIGFSMGGYGTWSAAAVQPELFAAIVPIAGGGSKDLAGELAEVPIWAFHGGKDEVIPAEHTKNLVEAIRLAGGSPKLTLYPDVGHGIRDRVCCKPELWDWLFQQSLERRQQTAASSIYSEE
ncbi:MAG: prolyl oligopeptidase family serine peptidase [Pirellulales bacterium]|nr:prolyl oligopeptidase family serine peptidase [Pirellulales bacterium]